MALIPSKAQESEAGLVYIASSRTGSQDYGKGLKIIIIIITITATRL